MRELDGITVLVTGVTSGFGRAVAEALVEAGARVAGVAGAAGVARAAGVTGVTGVTGEASVEAHLGGVEVGGAQVGGAEVGESRAGGAEIGGADWSGSGGEVLSAALGEGFVAVPQPSGPSGYEAVLRRHDPQLLVLASVREGSLDPREAFEWTAAALRLPRSKLADGGAIIAVSGEAVTGEAVSGGAVPGGAVPGGAAPGDAELDEAASGAAPSNAFVGEGASCETGPVVPLGALAAYVTWEGRREGVRLRFVSVVVPPFSGDRLLRAIGRRPGSVPAVVAGLRTALREVELGAEMVRLAALACSGPSRYTRSGDAARARLARSYRLTAEGLVPFALGKPDG